MDNAPPSYEDSFLPKRQIWVLLWYFFVSLDFLPKKSAMLSRGPGRDCPSACTMYMMYMMYIQYIQYCIYRAIGWWWRGPYMYFT
jgi:hypothetical protein